MIWTYGLNIYQWNWLSKIKVQFYFNQKFKMGHYFGKGDMGENMTLYLDFVMLYINKIKTTHFFRIKFPIDWAIWVLSWIILKFFEKISMGKNLGKSRGHLQNFNKFFYLKIALNSQNIRESIFEQWSGVAVKMSPLPRPSPHM